jgi:hypothetical protein
MGFSLRSVTNPITNLVSKVPVVGRPASGLINSIGGVAEGIVDPLMGELATLAK